MNKKNLVSGSPVKSVKEIVAEIDITNYTRNEFGFAKLYKDIFGDRLKYVASEKVYYLLQVKQEIWKADKTERLERNVEEFLSNHCVYLANNVADERERKKYIDWISSRQGASSISGILKCVRNKKGVAALSEDFDRYPRYFAIKNGVVDMKTSRFASCKKKYLITKQANVLYDPDNHDSTWREFLMSVFEDDEDMYDYILRSVSYAMEGDATAHCMFLLYGPTTRNGKSTLAHGLVEFFNDYAATIDQSSLARRKSSPGSPSPDVIKLKGKRMVNVPEIPQAIELDVAFIKTLTGQDILNSRALYKDYEEFTNNAVFFLHMNRLPIVKDATLFTSHRMIVIPFYRHFDIGEADPDMAKKLIQPQALSGLLNEIIRIRIKYEGVSIKDKLPIKVKDATQEFANACDRLGHFLRTKIIRKDKAWIPRKELYQKYCAFMRDKEESPIASKTFTDELANRQYPMTRRNSGYGLFGYKLIEK